MRRARGCAIASGLALGVLAAAIACGGSMPGARPAAPAVEAGGAAPAALVARAEIDRYAAAIDDELAQLGLARPGVPAGACVQQPCDAVRLAVPAPAADPRCHAPVSERCTEACRLSSSICDNAGRICRIATELGGGDAYANERCASGQASCEAARGRCCGCEV